MDRIQLSHLYQVRVLMELAFYSAFGVLFIAFLGLCFYCYLLRRDYYRESETVENEIKLRIEADHRAQESEAALKKAQEELKKAEDRPLSIEASQLLHDLTRTGNAVVRIVPLDPKDIFYRAPRGL